MEIDINSYSGDLLCEHGVLNGVGCKLCHFDYLYDMSLQMLAAATRRMEQDREWTKSSRWAATWALAALRLQMYALVDGDIDLVIDAAYQAAYRDAMEAFITTSGSW